MQRAIRIPVAVGCRSASLVELAPVVLVSGCSQPKPGSTAATCTLAPAASRARTRAAGTIGRGFPCSSRSAGPDEPHRSPSVRRTYAYEAGGDIGRGRFLSAKTGLATVSSVHPLPRSDERLENPCAEGRPMKRSRASRRGAGRLLNTALMSRRLPGPPGPSREPTSAARVQSAASRTAVAASADDPRGASSMAAATSMLVR